MAKSWKKWGKNGWKKGTKIVVVQQVQVTKGRDFYHLMVIDDAGWTSQSIDVKEDFKTKSQALKAARAYMRSH